MAEKIFTPNTLRNKNIKKSTLGQKAFELLVLSGKIAVFTGLTVGVVSGGAWVFDKLTGTPAAAEEFKSGKSTDIYANANIQSITLESGARLRSEPVVTDKADPTNIVDSVEQKTTIQTSNEVLIKDSSEANGKWYGIPIKNVEDVIPKFDDQDDKDNYVWVNELGVQKIEKDN